MRFNKKYKVILEDETSLEKKVNFRAHGVLLLLFFVCLTVVAGAFGVMIIASTPMKKMLPGYLKESERTATEEQHLRLDSLSKVYEVNEAYISGILNALNPSENPAQERKGSAPPPLSPDSLKAPSEEEKEFMEMIRERDKYNIGYISPAAAATMNFSPVNTGAVISEETKNKPQAEFILPVGNSVSAVAEGKVISVASSPKTAGGYEVIIQHPKGFLSKSGRLSNLFVRPGDRVAAGQIIASGTSNSGVKGNRMTFELWHDGDPLIPAQYIHGGERR